MNAPRDPETILAAWLDEGPTVLPDTARRAIAVSARSTHQTRRRLPAPWRFTSMSNLGRGLAAVAVVAVVAVAGIYVLGPRIGGFGGSPTPSPTIAVTPEPTPAPTPAPTVAGTLDYTSTRFAYNASYPGDWTLAQATQDWASSEIAPNPRGSNVDDFNNPANDAWIFVSSRPLASGETATSLETRVNDANAAACDASNPQPVTLGGGVSEQAQDLFCDGPIQVGVRRDHFIEIVTVQNGRAYFIDFISPDLRDITALDREAYLQFVASMTFGG